MGSCKLVPINRNGHQQKEQMIIGFLLYCAANNKNTRESGDIYFPPVESDQTPTRAHPQVTKRGTVVMIQSPVRLVILVQA